MECARMLKLGNLTEHLEELLHQAQEKQLTYPEFLLACLKGGAPDQREPEIFVPFESGRASCKA